jgi:hypothetical protein
MAFPKWWIMRKKGRTVGVIIAALVVITAAAVLFNISIAFEQNESGQATGGTGTADPLSINGSIFNDLNGNGVRDSGEPGLANWTITLTAPYQKSPINTLTDSNGNYTFTGLAPGNYTVGEVLQSGWIQTAPKNGTYLVSINGTDVTGQDFGNVKPTLAQWTAWQENISHQPIPGRGCFEADYPNLVWQSTTCAPSTSRHSASSHSASSHTLTFNASTHSATVGEMTDQNETGTNGVSNTTQPNPIVNQQISNNSNKLLKIPNKAYVVITVLIALLLAVIFIVKYKFRKKKNYRRN